MTPSTQVSESWTMNELLHFRGEMNSESISYHLERELEDTGKERKRNSIFLSFNSFPCLYLYFYHLEHSVPVTGFIIWKIHVLFKHALFDPCSKFCGERTFFSGLNL